MVPSEVISDEVSLHGLLEAVFGIQVAAFFDTAKLDLLEPAQAEHVRQRMAAVREMNSKLLEDNRSALKNLGLF